MYIILLFSVVLSYKNCSKSGQNNQILVLQCDTNYSIFIENKHLDFNNLKGDSFKTIQIQGLIKQQLSNNLFVMLLEEKTLDDSISNYYLQTKQMFFGYNISEGETLKYQFKSNNTTYVDFHNTMLDGIVNLLSFLDWKEYQQLVLLNLIIVQPGNRLNIQKEFRFLMPNCSFKSYGQYFNKIRNSLILTFQCSDVILIYESHHPFINLTHQQAYSLDYFNTTQSMTKAIYFEEYVLIYFQDFASLYVSRPVSLDLLFIGKLPFQNVQFIKPTFYHQIQLILILENGQIYQVYETGSWQKPYKMQYVQKAEGQFNIPIYNLDSAYELQIALFDFEQLVLLCAPNFMIDNNTCQQCYTNELDQYQFSDDYQNYLDFKPYQQSKCIVNCQIILEKFTQDSVYYQYCKTGCNEPYDQNYPLQSIKSIFNQIDFADGVLNYSLSKTIAESNGFNVTMDFYKQDKIKERLIYSDFSCKLNCTELFPYLQESFINQSAELVPYNGECILNIIQQQLVQKCSLYQDCMNCTAVLGCEWYMGSCIQEIQYYEISQFVEENSKWKFGKQFQQCEVPQACTYDQSIFNKEHKIQLSGYISQGQLCTWFFDSHQYSIFQLEMLLDADNPNVSANTYICFSYQYNQLCDIRIMNQGFNETGQLVLFKGNYFRVIIQFKHDVIIKNFELKFQYQKVPNFFEKLKNTIIQLLVWLFLGIVVALVICFYAKRRLQILAPQEFGQVHIELVVRQFKYNQDNLPLSTARLQQVMESLQDQGLITKYPSDDSLIIYGQDNCSFCMETYDVSDMVVQIFCGHVFHYSCFESWIQTKGNFEKCPTCNQKCESFLANRDSFSNVQSRLLENLEQYQNQTQK